MNRIYKAFIDILEDNDNIKFCDGCDEWVVCTGKRDKWCREFIENALSREGKEC